MRVKTPVHFQMAPKKSTKGKDVAAQPTRDEGWVPSKCSDSDLEALVSAGLLPAKSVIQWRPALGQDRPYENTGKIIAFVPYFEWGLGMGIGAPMFIILLWAPVLLQDPASPLDPKFFCSYFHLRTFVRSFFWH